MRIIPEWRRAWRMISVQCMTVALAMQAAWAAVPADLRDTVPPSAATIITVVLLTAGIIGRLVQQPKVKEGAK